VLGGGFIGMCLGFGMQYWSAVINYPINVGGRPLASIPAFVPISFEMFVLFGAFSGVFGMLLLNRLPMPYHPAFNVPEFKEVTRDRFFLCIEARDPKFDADATRTFLTSLNPLGVSDVEA
jgi:Alternative complex III, ActD subunit